MVRHIFLLCLRNSYRNWIYTLAILLSLSIGFTVANVLIGFTLRELHTDTHHSKKDRIYRLVSEDPFGREGAISYMEKNIPDYILAHYPEIEKTSMVYSLRYNGISVEGSGDLIYEPTLLRTDSSFLDIFDFQLSDGHKNLALTPGKIILSNDLFNLMFKRQSPGHQALHINVDSVAIPLDVSGIIQAPIENSHLRFDGLVHNRDFSPIRGGICYILLNEDAHIQALEDKINNDPSMPSLIGPGKINYHFQPLREVYFDEDNARSFSKARGRFFIGVSWAITIGVLFLAGFNFLNLFANAFLKRWKEFGLKKILGAELITFRTTAILEVLLYVALSFGLSLVLTANLLPWFNALLTTELSMPYYTDARIIWLLATVIFIIAVVVIFHLTHYLYKIDPVSLIRNHAQFKAGFNRYMLGMQFFISIILLICSYTIIRQILFIQNKPLGFNRNMIELRAPPGSDMNRMAILKNRINEILSIQSSSLCSGNPISDNMIARYDLDNGTYYTPYIFIGDHDYLETIGLLLVRGEVPSEGNTNGRLVNEAFIEYFDLKNPLGEHIPGTSTDYIAGIVKNFNISSLHQEVPPAILSISQNLSTLIARIDMDQLGEILPQLEECWKQVYPSYPFRYLIIDDELMDKHKDDMVFSKIIVASTMLSMLITCFGLFALSWGIMRERTKEIGIRKVVGASSGQIAALLLRNYIKIILMASLVGIPAGIYLMNQWLEKFAFRVEVNMMTLVICGLIILGISILTVGYHTVKSSRQNPVDVLRYE